MRMSTHAQVQKQTRKYMHKRMCTHQRALTSFLLAFGRTGAQPSQRARTRSVTGRMPPSLL